MHKKNTGCLIGFIWFSDDGTVILAVGAIVQPGYRYHPDYVFISLTLNHNQRLVGVKSSSDGDNKAEHRSF